MTILIFFFTCFHNSCKNDLCSCTWFSLILFSLISTLVARIFHVGSGSCSLNLLNAIPLQLHAIILIKIVCSFPDLVTRIHHVHVHVKFIFIFTHFHVFMFKFKFIFIQTKIIFSSQSPRHQVHVITISVTQICQSNTIVAFINSYVHKVPLSSVSSNGGEMEHSHPSEYPAALKFCPKSLCLFFFKHSLLTTVRDGKFHFGTANTSY